MENMKEDLKDENVNDEGVLECEEKLENEDELKVESYSPYKLKSKKRSIVTRIAMAGVVAVIGIRIAGLVINFYYPDAVENIKHAVQSPIDTNLVPHVLGGSGSWFLSRLERVDG